MPPERVLITGANGYVGSVLTPYLLSEGYSVTALDTFTHQGLPLAACLPYEGFTPIRGDCRDTSTLREALKGVDWIIPLAAVVGAPACMNDYYKANSVNYESIITLLECRSKNQPILFPTTNSGYGTTPEGQVSTEDTLMDPISLYGYTKCKAEKHLLDKENIATFRLATVFGASPRMRLDLLVNDFVHRAVRDKAVVLYEANARRNYMHVYDVARLFVFGLKNFEKIKGKPWNAGIPGALTKKELCQEIQKYVKGFTFVEAEVGTDIDKRDYNVSVERLENAGFKCCVSITYGLRELIRCYKMLPVERFRNA